jgi:hypothetical protein
VAIPEQKMTTVVQFSRLAVPDKKMTGVDKKMTMVARRLAVPDKKMSTVGPGSKNRPP